MSDTIKVKSTLPQAKDGGWPVAFFEQNDAHPDGEAYIADDETHEVAPTAAATLAISRGNLKIVGKAPSDLNIPPAPPSPAKEEDKK